jgi:hypothetical protein
MTREFKNSPTNVKRKFTAHNIIALTLKKAVTVNGMLSPQGSCYRLYILYIFYIYRLFILYIYSLYLSLHNDIYIYINVRLTVLILSHLFNVSKGHEVMFSKLLKARLESCKKFK